MLKAQKPNSRTTMDSSSKKLSKEIEILFFFFNFKQMEVVEFETSSKPLDRLRTQEILIQEKTSTMI